MVLYSTGLTGLIGSIAFFGFRPAPLKAGMKLKNSNLAFGWKKIKKVDGIVCSVVSTFASADLVFPLSSEKRGKESPEYLVNPGLKLKKENQISANSARDKNNLCGSAV